MQIAVLVIVFCLAMAAIGVLAVVIFRQSAPPVQIPTPMAVTLPATSLSGWDLPATWTPTITLTSPPSNTPPPTDTPAPFTPISLFTFAKTPIPSYAIGPSTGLLAPGFSLKDLSDAQVSLSDYAGRPVILLFWATWCPYCEREMGSLQDIYEAYQKSGLAVLAIDCGDPAGQVRSYRNSHGLTFPVLVDAKSKTLKLYQANSFPTHFFIAPDGRITHIAVGTMTGAGLEKQVGVITRLQP
jgi:peroxiredoxin